MTVAEAAEPVLNAFAGPAGWEEGARIIGLREDILGVEIDEQACTAAVTAGHQRHLGDIRDVDPKDYPHVKGFICSTPCPTFSPAGLRSGLGNDYQTVLDVITHAGSGCDCTWEEIEAELDGVTDPRTALAAQTIRFALGLPNLEWLAFEQVPKAEYMFEDIAAELMSYYDGETGEGPGWVSADVLMVEAADLGMPVRRKRVFLVARRYTPFPVTGYPYPSLPPRDLPERTMAQALGWEAGHKIRTRANRRPTGGNLFSADGPSWCLTEKARTWERDADGLRLTASEAGMLQGFRPDYPWQGSRTRQFHQLADVVCPPVAAAVLGYVTGTPWPGKVRAYLDDLYGPGSLPAAQGSEKYFQTRLF
jgi:DNA (cytosine-5)-methyltransferase 1